jgi:trans-2,3-dihydro-3-hydroxyanthranilate isomerase
MDFRYVVCDVFTNRPLTGNQLAVFTDARAIPEALLPLLAREMNFSETVFVYPAGAGGHARIRIFTPGTELPFAGHPVLGTAFVLAAPLQLETIVLETGIGPVPVALLREGPRIVFGWMTQPIPKVEPVPEAPAILTALGVARAALPVERYVNGPRHVMVNVEAPDQVARLAPDLAALARATKDGVSCFAGAGTRWKTRMFAPGHGISEDPATGSAAGPLACHLLRHGRIASGAEIEIAQGAEIGRPSPLYARVTGTRETLASVEVGGSAVTVARGEFRLPT